MDELRMRLERTKAALLVVDIQERMCAAMDQEKLQRMTNRCRALIEGAKAMRLPIIVTEQYSKGLGPTVEPLRAVLPDGTRAIEKNQFSCALPEVLDALADRKQVLLCGMETHVCVFQTARDLLERGLMPYLCADALLSRTAEDKRWGLERARDLGAVVTTAEGALFDLLGCAGTPEFKVVSAAVR
ncbi:MAG: isochorismatase family protein [Myxococcales bacterium]|jgi:nicotinamidase-related amidase